VSVISDDVKRYQLILSVIFGIGCAILLSIVGIFGIESEVMKYRFMDAEDVFNGRSLAFEFPPLALLFVVIPRIFASTPYGYFVVYAATMFVFFVIGLFIICKIAERFNKDQKKFMLAYTFSMLLLLEFVIDRHDIIPVVMTLAAIYCFITKRYTLAFVLLALGAMIKLYPAILFPIFLIPLIMDKDWKEVLKGAGAFATVLLAVVIPVMLFQPDMMSYFIGYHADRPLQIESVAASLIFLFSMAGLTEVQMVFTYGSENVIGPWPDAVAPWLTPLMMVSVMTIYIVYAYMLNNIRGRGNENDRSYLFANAMLLSVMMFIIVGKVFSSQYLMWLIPPLLFMFMLPSDANKNRMIYILFAVIIALAQIQFVYNSGYLGGGENINNFGKMLIIVKNMLLVAMVYCVIKLMYDRYRQLRRPSEVS
jgi:Gpi18-like mannosyltransferase